MHSIIKRESMNLIKNVKFRIKESTSGKNKLMPEKTIIGKKKSSFIKNKTSKKKK